MFFRILHNTVFNLKLLISGTFEEFCMLTNICVIIKIIIKPLLSKLNIVRYYGKWDLNIWVAGWGSWSAEFLILINVVSLWYVTLVCLDQSQLTKLSKYALCVHRLSSKSTLWWLRAMNVNEPVEYTCAVNHSSKLTSLRSM